MSEFTDLNADQVHAFALEMGNLGLARVKELITAMYDSGVWREFRDGSGVYAFLPGEFDYFLTQQGVTREQVLHGIQDVEAKAHLEDGMDERRTGEEGYRRSLEEARASVPERVGRPIEPFGYTGAEGRRITGRKVSREPLGRASRQFRITGGVTTKRPNELVDRTTRLTRAVLRLPDAELQRLLEAINYELQTRKH